MKRCFCALALAGCHSAPATKPLGNQPHESVPIVRFAISDGDTVQILRTSDTGLVVERTATVPDTVSRIVWAGADPAVWLDLWGDWRGPGFPGDDTPPGVHPVTGPHENEMGLVTANGYVKFPRIDWPTVPKPGDDNFGDLATEVTDENAVLHASKDGIWQERCFWFGGPDGGWCLTSKFARRAGVRDLRRV